MIPLTFFHVLKSIRLTKNFQEMLDNNGSEEIQPEHYVERLMRDATKANKGQLPNTFFGSDLEFAVSSIFVDAKTDWVS